MTTKTNAKNPAKVMHMTAVGVVGTYPYLQKPDYGNDEFPKPRGEWSCKLAIPNARAQKTVDAIVKASAENFAKYEASYPKLCADAKAAGKRPPKKLVERDFPFYEDGEGNTVFTFKGHASWVDKNNGNETKAIALRVYDSAGKRIFEVPNINRNSEGRVEFSIVPYQSSVADCGVKLQLSKFQLLKLVEFTANGNDTFGGSDDDMEGYEGGYVAPKPDTFGGDREQPPVAEYEESEPNSYDDF